jgi:6-phosphogluconolactonase
MAEPINTEALTFPGVEELSRSAAKRIVDEAQNAVNRRGRFTLVLSGGSTPRVLYSLLASEFKENIPWTKTHLFWGDERYVPKDHSESNYGSAYKILISKLRIPKENVHPIPTEFGNPQEAASIYERDLKEFYIKTKSNPLPFTFDLVLLGVGEDGHTASLFPGDPILKEKRRGVAAIKAPVNFETSQRISLTLSAFNRAKKVFFLVAGANKGRVVKTIFEDYAAARIRYPAAMINPVGRITWFLDKTATNVD